MTVSIIICTRNQAESLRPTLESIGRADVPSGWDVELLVVDNGSTDHTYSLVRETKLTNVTLRYEFEPTPGQCHARNKGLQQATGEVILFTDDDVRVPVNWIEGMCQPIIDDRYDAVTGCITLGRHLERNWFTPLHLRWLASQETVDLHNLELVGASMAFHRRVLARIPLFDPELGPGAIGFGDDTLFSNQLQQVGFRIGWVPEAKVIHNPDPVRLTRREWLKAARKRGATQAYLLYHWRHEHLKFPRLKCIYIYIKLIARRVLQFPAVLHKEGCSLWEISYVANIAMFGRYQTEARQRRKYDRLGVVKLTPDE